ncbi:MAG: hypothetical protein ACT4P6_12115 [Gemmatimonadaceae bacterium]
MNLQRALSALFSMIPLGVAELPGMFGPQARIVRQFQDAGALSPHSARRFYPRSSAEATAFAALLEAFVICQSAPGHYFLNREELQERANRLLTWRQ